MLIKSRFAIVMRPKVLTIPHSLLEFLAMGNSSSIVRVVSSARQKKYPDSGGGIFRGTVRQRKSRMRMMSGIGIPTSQRRMGMVFSLRVAS